MWLSCGEHLVGPGKGWNVLHLLVQWLVMYWSVLNADLVLAWLLVIEVGHCVLHPLLIVPLRKVLPGMCPSALL